MRESGWVLSLLVCLAASAWAQKENAAPKQAQTETPVLAPSTPAAGPSTTDPPTCPVGIEDSLATDGIVGKDRKGIEPPKPQFMPQAELSNEARREIHDEVKEKIIVNFEAKSVLGLIVDVNGNPQGVCIWKAAGLGLDLQAAKAVRRYKFKPATKDGKPVPMRLAVAVTFRAN